MPKYPLSSGHVKEPIPALPPTGNGDLLQKLLAAALTYRKRGWSCFPLIGKEPAGIRWKAYQTRLPSEVELRKWFGPGSKATGIGIICGAGVTVRDFDDDEAGRRCLAANPEVAKLPRVKTARGCHVYFQTATPLDFKKFPDGELRAAGCYVVAPPSIHPETGKPYVWEVLPPDGPLPVVDVSEMGLDRSWAAEVKVRQGSLIDDAPTEPAPPAPLAYDSPSTQLLHDSTTPLLRYSITLNLKEGEIQAIAEKRVPPGRGRNNRALFLLVRDIWAAIGRKPTYDEGKPFFEEWHRLAVKRGVLRPGQSKLDYRLEFEHAIDCAQSPTGTSLFAGAVDRAKAALADTAKFPSWLVELADSKVQLLALLCRELQKMHGEKPFYLASGKAAKVVEVSAAMTAWRYLGLLVRMEHLKVAKPGKTGEPGNRVATRYLWIREVVS